MSFINTLISIDFRVYQTLVIFILGSFLLRRKTITLSGFIALVGIAYAFIITSNIQLFFLPVLMFLSSTLISKLTASKNLNLEVIHEKEGARDYVQALSNFGPGILFYTTWYYTNIFAFEIAFIASIACACADTWASEIGILSKEKPVNILSLKPTAKGVSGGITILGILSGVAGSAFISLCTYYCLNYDNIYRNLSSFILSPIFIIPLTAGVIGFMLDSIYGALFQALYIDEKGNLSEKKTNELLKGMNWINNDTVNFLACLSSGTIAHLCYSFIS